MNEQQKILNDEQKTLVAELTKTYGVKPEEIIFFTNDPNPFLTYEATCALANQLVNLQVIDISPEPSVSSDSLSLKCSLMFSDGRTRSAVGVVNFGETIDGVKMTEAQIYQLASSRAIRNALRTADIDLIKLHHQRNRNEPLDFKMKSNTASLIAQSHLLGKEAYLIQGENKTAWYRQLQIRYQVNSSKDLNEAQLADWVAFLKTLVPQKQMAA